MQAQLDTKGRNQMGDLHVGERILKLNFREIGCEDINWIKLAQVMVH
jgi:hypothetical protein